MTTGAGAICFACSRRTGGMCTAFPDGIPDEILFGGFDHRQPHGGEVDGLLFDLKPGEEAALAAYEKIQALMPIQSLTAANDQHDERGRFGTKSGSAAPSTSTSKDIKSQIATWESTKPWAASREDIEAGKFPGIVVGQARGSEAASYDQIKGRIVLKDDYFNLPDEDSKRSTLYHEAGHGLESDVGDMGLAPYFGVENPLDIIDLPGARRFGDNYSEIAAEAYGTLWSTGGIEWASGFDGGEDIINAVTKMAQDQGYPTP